MKNKIFCEIEVDLMGKKYTVYLKEVATKIAKGGKPLSTTLRAFVRRIKRQEQDL